MGEFADLEIEREQERRGRALAQQHARMNSAQRAAADAADRKAESERWEAAFAEMNTRKAELDAAGITVTKHKGRIEAKRGEEILGLWFPHKRGKIGQHGCSQMPATQWVGRVLKLVRQLDRRAQRVTAAPGP